MDNEFLNELSNVENENNNTTVTDLENDLNQTQTELAALKNEKEKLVETLTLNDSPQNMSPESQKNNAKVLTKDNGHSLLPKDSRGFATSLLITLLTGFGIGAVATATYIFINLGKVTFTL